MKIILAMMVFTAGLIYTGDFLGCYHMKTFSTSCDWWFDLVGFVKNL